MHGLGYTTVEGRLQQVFTGMYIAECRLVELTDEKDDLESDTIFRSFCFEQRAYTLFSEIDPEFK